MVVAGGSGAFSSGSGGAAAAPSFWAAGAAAARSPFVSSTGFAALAPGAPAPSDTAVTSASRRSSAASASCSDWSVAGCPGASDGSAATRARIPAAGDLARGLSGQSPPVRRRAAAGLLGRRQQALGLVLLGIAPQPPDLTLFRGESFFLRLIRRQLDRVRRSSDQRWLGARRPETGVLVRHPDDHPEHREPGAHRQHRPQPPASPRRLGRRGFAIEAWAAHAAGFGR